MIFIQKYMPKVFLLRIFPPDCIRR